MHLIPADPVNLSIKGKLLSVISCFSVILVMGWICQYFSAGHAYPILIASMGASAVIVFIIPNSPLAQPWPLVGGQLVSTLVGIVCAQQIFDTVLASAVAVGGSVWVMLMLRCLHPPGAASALAPVLSGATITSLGYEFLLMPVAINLIIMLGMALIINRWLLRHDYPLGFRPLTRKVNNPSSISEQDLEQALQNRDTFVDISSNDLSRLLTDAQKHSYKRFSGQMTCLEIMTGNVLTVDYGTEVEEAWKLMHREKLKALPVIDRSRRVVGMITWHDFFKFIKVNNRESFQDKVRSFIRRTPDTSTDKPESVGHIMASPVTVLTESTHIVELIPLMSNQGYRQIPIVNNENRLVGMVYQANLIAALYNESFTRARA